MHPSPRQEKAIKEQAELKTQNWLKRMKLGNNDHMLTQQTINDKRAEFESQLRELVSSSRNPKRKTEITK